MRSLLTESLAARPTDRMAIRLTLRRDGECEFGRRAAGQGTAMRRLVEADVAEQTLGRGVAHIVIVDEEQTTLPDRCRTCQWESSSA